MSKLSQTSSATAHLSEMPPILYGTAWKKSRTADLVYTAIQSGFRGIDTASIETHYNEAGVGAGIRRAIDDGIVTRNDLWIQTKHHPSLNPSTPITTHINNLVHRSLAQLCTTHLDAVLLHEPYPTPAQTLQAWTTLSSHVPHRIRTLGLSNVTLPILKLLSSCPVQPTIIQNPLIWSQYSYDIDVRRYCAATGMRYQGYSIMSGNTVEWGTCGFVRDVAEGAGVDRSVAWSVMMVEGGVTVLSGTMDSDRMKGVLGGMESVRAWRGTEEGKEVWGGAWREFVGLVGV